MKTKRIIFPVLAAMLAIGAAFATSEKKEEKSKPVLATYFVTAESGGQYHVTTTPDLDCGAGSEVCEISTAETPVEGRVPVDKSTPIGWKN